MKNELSYHRTTDCIWIWIHDRSGSVWQHGFLQNQSAEKQETGHEHVFSLVIWCPVEECSVQRFCSGSRNGKVPGTGSGFILDTISDGFVVYGGIIGGILAGCMYCKIQKEQISGNILIL